MTLNDILQAVAAALKAIWPSRKVYDGPVQQDAEGVFYVTLTDTEQAHGLDRQQRRTAGVQVRYFLQSGDTTEYLKWAETMFDHFRSLSLGGRTVHLSNQTARSDADSRYYQFLFDVDLCFVEAAAEQETMETLKIKEVVP